MQSRASRKGVQKGRPEPSECESEVIRLVGIWACGDRCMYLVVYESLKLYCSCWLGLRAIKGPCTPSGINALESIFFVQLFVM